MVTVLPRVTLNREFVASPDSVYEAWTVPTRLAEWWGPRCFTNPVCRVDARPGGEMEIHMRAPDGSMFPMRATFVEVEAGRRLVFTAGAFEDAEGNFGLETVTTVTFESTAEGTRLTVQSRAAHVEPAYQAAVEGMEEGWTQSLDKLGELLTHNA